MSLTLVTKPSQYPVTLAEMKAHLVVEHNDDDALIDTYIGAATEWVEKYTGRDLIQRTWDYSFDKFPIDDIVLPRSPVQSVSSITYTDQTSSPILQTVATTVYDLDSGRTPSFVYLKYNQTWPSATYQHNSITVRFVSGYEGLGSPQDLAGNVPEAIKAGIKLIVGDLYMTREKNTDIQTYDNQACKMLLSSYRLFTV